jgi:hypothetical protein
MKRLAIPAAVSALVLAAGLSNPAAARCVSSPAQVRAMTNPSQTRSFAAKLPAPPVRGLTPDATGPEPSIVGYWYVRFLAGSQLIDDGFDLWTSDGLEILNDTTPPAQGAVCLGIWTKMAPYIYALKHPSWIFDDAGVNVTGVAMIKEEVVIDPAGDTFTGVSTIDVYDLGGNLLVHSTADMTGQRIRAVDSPPSTAPIPGLPQTILSR